MHPLRGFLREAGKCDEATGCSGGEQAWVGVDTPVVGDGDHADAERLTLVEHCLVVVILGCVPLGRLVTSLVLVRVHLQRGTDPACTSVVSHRMLSLSPGSHLDGRAKTAERRGGTERVQTLITRWWRVP